MARRRPPAAWVAMEERYKPQRGDEARLFAEFHEHLVRRVAGMVVTTPEVVEDACNTAWTQFLIHQPDRERSWKGWLIKTAQREAWRLHHDRFNAVAIDPGEAGSHPRAIAESADPTDPIARRLAFDSAIELLERLPPRLRRIAFLRATGMRYRDIGEITGDSPTRVNQLVATANQRLQEALYRTREPDRELPPRVKRLRILEDAPPTWLVSEVGRPPRGHDRRVAYAQRLLAWRRAALAIDDYRAISGFSASDRGLGERPRDPAAARAFDLARHAIERVERCRVAARGIDDAV